MRLYVDGVVIVYKSTNFTQIVGFHVFILNDLNTKVKSKAQNTYKIARQIVKKLQSEVIYAFNKKARTQLLQCFAQFLQCNASADSDIINHNRVIIEKTTVRFALPCR